MRVSLAWLAEYVDIVLPAQQLAERLTLAGLEVKSVEVIGGSWDRVRVGQIKEVKPHPNADRLRLVTVALGDAEQTVVCGAPNLTVGDNIAFAGLGARLVDGHTGEIATLKAARIRGVLSEGMVCSEKELGVSDNHQGIMVLPKDAPVGASLASYLGDTVLDLDLSPNRPDWLSMLGIAREVGALTGQRVRMPDEGYAESDAPVQGLASVQIADPDLCPRYCATVVTGVTIGPSPRWMQRRLEAYGMRPINNVVDVTNYVMLEYGQPLHAFDFSYLTGRKVIVRRANEGEYIISLDGVERELKPGMLLIADERRPVAVAGVMGGANSEVSDATNGVLLESANFSYASIRRTAGALGMRSEASIRFEKGLPAELPLPAARRATRLILETAGGQAASGVIDVYPGRRESKPIVLVSGEVKRLLGMDVPVEQSSEVLDLLGFSCRVSGQGDIEAGVPFWRSDVAQGADLVEEVARIVGYDRIPLTTIASPIPPREPSPLLEMKEVLRDTMTSCGFQEVITYSLTSLEDLKKAVAGPGEPGPGAVRLANPMSFDHEFLRTSLRPRMLLTLAQNQRFEEVVRVFEMGRVFLPRPGDLPHEVEMLCGLLAGPRDEMSWRARPGQVDFYDAKGVVEAVMRRLGVDGTFQDGDESGLRPGRCAGVLVGAEKVGVVGEAHPRVVETFKASGPVFMFELNLERLLPAVSAEFRYEPLPRFPGSIRDVALVVDVGVSYQSVLDVVRSYPLVGRVTLFDVYQGGQVPPGKKSLAFRVVYQSPERTLTDDEVGRVQQEMLEALQGKLGAVLRS